MTGDLNDDGHRYDSVVIGAGQAGLSTAHHLDRLGIDHVVLDANPRPGGAWQHRWDGLTMADVHGIADLPGTARPAGPGHARANAAVPGYFADYERALSRPVIRPVRVLRVDTDDEGFVLRLAAGSGPRRTGSGPRRTGSGPRRTGSGLRSVTTVHARTLVNATGTWTRPFVPSYPGQGDFAGTQLHTVAYPGPDWFAGRRTVVVGGGASAVQFLGELAPVLGADGLVWVTRTPPDWRTGEFTPEVGAAAVARVQQRVAEGLAPRSVVSVTGLRLREQEQQAERLGVYRARRPMFDRITAHGVHWDHPGAGRSTDEAAEVILWATGFRPAVDHLAPLRLRSPRGGIRLAADGTTAVADPRVQLVGYGPSASTIGANRAGRRAALGVRRALGRADGPPGTADRGGGIPELRSVAG